jgi:iron complex transport system ATP-binding protein
MSPSVPPIFSCRDLTITVPGRTLVRNLSLTLEAGEFLAVLGQNGAGKSLTLHTLAGLRDATSGDTFLRDSSLSGLPRQRIAQDLALLPQYTEDVFPASVMDTVMIGRHPHIGRFQWESAEDIAIARHCLQAMDLEDMMDRDVTTLSGGERRRLAIAEVLTQMPVVYLLDEPTNHLDPQHQLDVLHVFRDKSASGSVVVASLHDINLAARFADHCLLLFGDGSWEFGATDVVLTEARLSELYSTPMEAVQWRKHQLFVASRQQG